jgi:hypothetical protein
MPRPAWILNGIEVQNTFQTSATMDSLQVNQNSSQQCTELRQHKNIEYNIKILIHIVLYIGSQIPVVCPQSFSSLALHGIPQNNPPEKDQHHILHNSTQTLFSSMLRKINTYLLWFIFLRFRRDFSYEMSAPHFS